MKVMKKRILKITAFLLAAVILFSGVMSFLKVNELNGMQRIRGFYMEDENSLDVVLIGASELYSSYSAGLNWDQYGFTSYPMSYSSCPGAVVKSEIKEILKRQNPKLIVIEVNGFLGASADSEIPEAMLRKYIDNIPWSQNKIDTIEELVPEDQKSSFYFNFLKYHSNWSDFKNCAYAAYTMLSMEMRGHSLLKGMKTITNIASKEELKDVSGDYSEQPLGDPARESLEDLLQYLEDEDITNVLFIRAPHRINDKNYNNYRRSNTVGKIVQEHGFTFVNFEQEKQKMGIDESMDYYSNEHLNVYGMEKFTPYLGKYLTEHYDFSDCTHTEKQIEQWNESARYSKAFIEYAKGATEEGTNISLFETVKTMKRLKMNIEKDS